MVLAIFIAGSSPIIHPMKKPGRKLFPSGFLHGVGVFCVSALVLQHEISFRKIGLHIAVRSNFFFSIVRKQSDMHSAGKPARQRPVTISHGFEYDSVSVKHPMIGS